MTVDELGPWRDHTRILRRNEARGAIAEAKQTDAGPLLMFGSLSTWNDLLEADLVDELHLMVGAGVLLDGVPAFAVKPPGNLRLSSARQLGDSSLALLVYALS